MCAFEGVRSRGIWDQASTSTSVSWIGVSAHFLVDFLVSSRQNGTTPARPHANHLVAMGMFSKREEVIRSPKEDWTSPLLEHTAAHVPDSLDSFKTGRKLFNRYCWRLAAERAQYSLASTKTLSTAHTCLRCLSPIGSYRSRAFVWTFRSSCLHAPFTIFTLSSIIIHPWFHDAEWLWSRAPSPPWSVEAASTRFSFS